MTDVPIVCDASPILAYHAIDRLDLVRQLFVTVTISSAVASEVAPSIPRPPDWIVERPLSSPVDPRVLHASLDLGERETLALALELDAAWVVLDDLRARRLAREIGLAVVGSVGIVIRAKQRGLVEAARPTFDALVAAGLFVGPTHYHDALVSVGELERAVGPEWYPSDPEHLLQCEG